MRPTLRSNIGGWATPTFDRRSKSISKLEQADLSKVNACARISSSILSSALRRDVNVARRRLQSPMTCDVSSSL